MKRTTTFLAALLIVIGAAFATEGEKTNESKISVVQWNEHTHQLFYLGKEEGKVIVKVIDESGKTLFRRAIKNEIGFALPLNFSKQADGAYNVLVQDGEQTYSAEFEVTKD